MFLRRIHCHFCGARSPHSKSSGITEFACASCEAVNYLDSQGNIIDTPAAVAVKQQRGESQAGPVFQTFTKPLPETLYHQNSQPFCNTCLLNQRIYLETLSNYLPDEGHPEFQKYVDGLPEFKRSLEKRYPQICTKCAPNAQAKINRADYFAGTSNVAKMAARTRERGVLGMKGQRDNWFRWSMRRLLGVLGWIALASLMVQGAWHVYGICITLSGTSDRMEGETVVYAFDAVPLDCLRELLRMRLHFSCYDVFARYIPIALAVSGCLLWHNPSLTDWFHDTHRMEAITGIRDHALMQLLLLGIRILGYIWLSDPATVARLSVSHVLAAHGLVLLMMVVIHRVCQRLTKAERFKLNFKITPKPEERDVLSAYAGPGTDEYDRQASSVHPSHLLNKDRIAPFPIVDLAPKCSSYKSTIPSPPPSDVPDDEDIDDKMDIDQPSSLQSQMPGAKVNRVFCPRFESRDNAPSNQRSLYNHGNTQGAGWSGIRDRLFDIQDNMIMQENSRRKEQEERAKLRYQPPANQSPFRGRLPPAPRSMESKLRNPISQVTFKKVEPSQQQNFMQQIRDGIEAGKTFLKQPAVQPGDQQKYIHDGIDVDEDFSPAKTRTRGSLDLKPSTWSLPSDVSQSTGLEDLLGGNNFRIADDTVIDNEFAQHGGRKRDEGMSWMLLGGAFPIAFIVILWISPVVRHAVCMSLFNFLESLGYES